MNKKYLGIVAGMLLLAGCSNDEFNDISNKVQQGLTSFSTVKATIGNSIDTRANLVSDAEMNNVYVEWDEEDYIYVYSDQEQSPYYYSLVSADKNVGTFAGNEVTGEKFYAFYSAGWDFSINEENPNMLDINLNSAATKENGYNHCAPMVAVSNDNSFDFKQVTGMIHIEVGNIPRITEIWFESNNDEFVGGNGYVDLSEDAPVFRLYNDSDHWRQTGIYHVVPDYMQMLDESETYDVYYYIPPQTFEHGFTITICGYDEEGNYFKVAKSTNAKVVVDRAQVRDYELIDVNAELEAQVEAEKRIREVLKLFYDALDGDNWYNNDNWNTDAPLNQWYGLETDEDGFLTEIELWDNNINGSIPKEIAELKHLKSLALAYGNITSIPDELCQMNLLDLSLADLGISTLPNDFGNLTHLTNLNLRGNQFTEVPEYIRQMKDLRYLDLSRNSICGELPEWISELTNLVGLYLSTNVFEGEIPATYFTNLTKLKDLFLFSNYLTGTITVEMQQSPMWLSLKDGGAINIEQRDDYYIEIEGVVRAISLNKNELTLRPGETFQLEVTAVLPDDALNKDTYWEEDDWYRQFATIDDNGLITAVALGDAWIYCRAADNNGAYAWCHVRVSSVNGESNTEGFNNEDKNWDN